MDSKQLRGSTALRVLVQMHALRGHHGQAAATEIDALLRRSPVRLVPALDRAVRDARTHRLLGLGFLELSPAEVAGLVRYGERASALLGVASLVRDGHTREAAVVRLGERVDRLTTAFLINRSNDYVRSVATRAWAGLERRMVPEHAGLVVACLPLIDRMEQWTRAGKAGQERLVAFLRSPHVAVRAAVRAGLTATDSEVVLGSAKLLAEVMRGRAEMAEVLAAALAARDPRTRLWAARLAMHPEWTPRAVFHALAPRLSLDRTPAIRLLGLHGEAQRGARAAIERAAFDASAEVRHQARVLLAQSFAPLDYRAGALRMLQAGADRRTLVTALALLSEFGRREDEAVLRGLAGDARASVRREAERALARLP